MASILASAEGSIALKSDGTSVAWGNAYGWNPPVGYDFRNVRKITVNPTDLYLAVENNGTLRGWKNSGSNDQGATTVPGHITTAMDGVINQNLRTFAVVPTVNPTLITSHPADVNASSGANDRGINAVEQWGHSVI